MIRARRSPNPRHSVFSADVLSEPEKSCQIHQLQKRKLTPRDGGRTWGDTPHLAEQLRRIRGNK